jgi:hypothetical protein
MDKRKNPCNEQKFKESLTKKDSYEGFKLETLKSTRSNFLVWKDFSI